MFYKLYYLYPECHAFFFFLYECSVWMHCYFFKNGKAMKHIFCLSVSECILAPFVSGSTTQHIPFVFLPLRGQIIHPSKEISFAGKSHLNLRDVWKSNMHCWLCHIRACHERLIIQYTEVCSNSTSIKLFSFLYFNSNLFKFV